MNLGSKILTAALLTAAPCLAAAAPVRATPTDAAMATVQKVDWRGGPHGEWFPDRSAGWGVGAGFALAAPYAYGYAPGYDYDYDYAPGYSTYAYGPGYDYGATYAAPAAPGRDIDYCAQRYRSYDPSSGTYLGYDGIRHPCP